VDEPNRFDYKVTHIIPGVLIRIDFHLGFKVDPKINLYFKEVLEDMVNAGEIKLESSYDSLRKQGFPGDFKFVLINRIMTHDFELTNTENFILMLQRIAGNLSISDVKSFNLDSSNTVVEQVPIEFKQRIERRISRRHLNSRL
jgi:KUP system potassium uptake protein